MGTTEIIRNEVCNELQWLGFFSEFALIDASVIVPMVQEDKKTEITIIDSLTFF